MSETAPVLTSTSPNSALNPYRTYPASILCLYPTLHMPSPYASLLPSITTAQTPKKDSLAPNLIRYTQGRSKQLRESTFSTYREKDRARIRRTRRADLRCRAYSRRLRFTALKSRISTTATSVVRE
ncbi:hypothetical protein G7Y89_g3512 [Cudoniella acicularis]|uniref:Uncharacterized protein n=1 Tax=Cudoniella acicularis TaxID=354080 RepID=A0A8H4W5W1_9HELO|nr:hypothetical protein G7Y89_g3512 [Cudoniella acicularis]